MQQRGNPIGNRQSRHVSHHRSRNRFLPKGSVHIYNLDGVRFRNERTGTSAASVDESFTDKAEYSTEKPVSQITVQGILYSKESAIITMQIKKDGESVFNQSKQLEAVPGIDTTVDLVYSTLK